MSDSEIIAAANGWLELDYHEPTRNAVKELLDAGNVAELRKLLGERLAFGTAGLRGPMGAGYNRMNHITVLQCTQGIVSYLEKTGPADLKTKGIVIGYDHRSSAKAGVDSEMMALTAAAVCVSRGIKTYLFSKQVATPIVAFCVKYKGCAAGMMVTASHNPKDDNGYKMYGGNGAQLCDPHDTLIADQILLNLAPWVDYKTAAAAVRSSPLCVDALAEVADAYFAEMASTLCFQRPANAAAALRIVYTAMHGVGAPFAARAFAAFGHVPFVPVPLQNDPDPTFPTVAYPNPEEGKGALELAFAAAAAAGAPLVLANDPDADRLAAAELQADGTWRIFSGNEIGALLAHWLLAASRYDAALGSAPPGAGAGAPAPAKYAVVASTVSSKMTRAIAQKEGMRFEETLTGFKWICNKKFDLQQEGYTVLLAFEESIGFCCGDLVNDKDGVCAAAVFAEMAVQLYGRGGTVTRHLDSLYARYGHFISRQGYVVVPDPKLTVAIFDRLRDAGRYPSACGPYAIAHVRDLTVGYDSSTADKKTTLPASTSSQHLTFTFANGCVANLRGSGTEPKLKYYVELSGPDRDGVTATLVDMVRTIVLTFIEPERNGIQWNSSSL